MNNESLIMNTFLDCSRTVLRIDTFSETLCVLKYEGVLSSDPETPVKCSVFLDSFLEEDKVFANDCWQFDILKDVNAFVYHYKHNGKGSAFIYRRKEGDKTIWTRIEVLIPSDHGAENPYIFLVSRDIDNTESAFFDSYAVFAQQIHKIMRFSLDSSSFMIIQESASERLLRKRAPVNSYKDEVEHVARHCIHPDDADSFIEHFSIEHLQHYFSMGNSEYVHFCRRMISGLYRWVRILVVPVRDYVSAPATFYCYVEDVHKEYLRQFDLQSAQLFARYYGGLSRQNIEVYYSNMLTVLHGLTQSYVDFYLVDLEKDLYIKYKLQSGTVKKAIPTVASYSQSSINYIKEHCSGQNAEMLSLYCTSEKLRDVMRGRMTLEYEFISEDGQKLRTICQKIESVNGVPTKVLCRTIECHDEARLVIQTFGNFEVLTPDGRPVHFSRKQSKQLLAYLIDRQGYPVTSKDIVVDILEKPVTDANAIKYCSTLIRRAMNDLANAGYPNVIIKEQKTVRVNTQALDCDYYHLLNGERSYLLLYHNEYMKEYSWAESTNAEILMMAEK